MHQAGGAKGAWWRTMLRYEGVVRSKKISDSEWALMFGLLAYMLEAGVSFIEALMRVGEVVESGLARHIDNWVRQLQCGESFSEALGRTDLRAEAVIASVRAGERSGNLAGVFHLLSGMYTHTAEMRGAVHRALIGPCITLAAAFLVLIGMTVLVVPRFAVLCAEQEIPMLTRLIFAASDVLISPIFWVYLGLVGAAVAAMRYVYSVQCKSFIRNGIRVLLPGIYRVYLGTELIVFFELIALQLSSGVPLADALEGARVSSGDPTLRTLGPQLAWAIRCGSSLSAELTQYRATLFLAPVVGIISAAERAGDLASGMYHAVKLMRGMTKRRIESSLAFLQPAAIVLVGGLVGLVLIALYAPLWTATNLM